VKHIDIREFTDEGAVLAHRLTEFGLSG